MSHLSPFILQPPPPGVCQECAYDHDKRLPHNLDSLFYWYYFYDKTGRWPTWDDAMAHCTEEVRDQWRVALKNVAHRVTA